MAKCITFLLILVFVGRAGASAGVCLPRSNRNPSDAILVESCEKLKRSSDCQNVYKRIKSEGNKPEDYELKCDLENLKRPIHHSLAIGTVGCIIGGWNFVADPITSLIDTGKNSAVFIQKDMELQKQLNEVCDQSIENKRKIYQAYNASVPQLLRVKTPSDSFLGSRSCAFLKADFASRKSQIQRRLEATVSQKAFQNNLGAVTAQEKEYLDWYKQGLADAGPDDNLMALARKGLHELDIRYECYNSLRASALLCQSLANAASGAMVVRKAVFELAGVQKLETTAMRLKYKGEDTGTREGFSNKVKYLSVEERAQYQVSIRNGKIYDSNNKLLDTSDAVSSHLNGESGIAIFVMDKQGNILISKRPVKGEFYHSSLVGGEPVAAAGEIQIQNGQIIRITDRSGHYEPNRKLMDQFKVQLKAKGIDVKTIQFQFKGKDQ